MPMNPEETTENQEPEITTPEIQEPEATPEELIEQQEAEILMTAKQEMIDSLSGEPEVEETEQIETEEAVEVVEPDSGSKQDKALASIAKEEKRIRDWEAQNKNLLEAGKAAYEIKDLVDKKQYWKVLEKFGITDANLLEEPTELPPVDKEKEELRRQLDQSKQDLQNQRNQQELIKYEKDTTAFIKEHNKDYPILSSYIDKNADEVINTMINIWGENPDSFDQTKCLATMEKSLLELANDLNSWRATTKAEAPKPTKKTKKTLTNKSASGAKNVKPKPTTEEEIEKESERIIREARKAQYEKM